MASAGFRSHFLLNWRIFLTYMSILMKIQLMLKRKLISSLYQLFFNKLLEENYEIL